MCGIYGRWNFDSKPIDRGVLHRSVGSIRHRGPDDEGYSIIDSRSDRWQGFSGEGTVPEVNLPHIQAAHFAGDVALGHARLSILDLSSAGHQPMSSPDGRCHISFNGEIYNFRELREELKNFGHVFRTGTDTEVVLAAYEEWGEECLQRFNGMWAFVLWDKKRRRLFAARDRFGIKPLVYWSDNVSFVCASEIKAIIADPGIPRVMDAEALHHYLSLSYVPAPLSIYRNIQKLLPGHFLTVDTNGILIKRYWHMNADQTSELDEPRALEELDLLLHDSVKLSLLADVPIGSFLSGGVDSSLVTAIAVQHAQKGSIDSFGIGFKGMAGFDETIWAQKVADHLKISYTAYQLELEFAAIMEKFAETMDEPFGSASVLGVYMLAREASKKIKVVLSGDGGDEVFAGYWTRQARLDQQWDAFKRKPFGWLRSATAVNGYRPVRWSDESLPRRLARRWRWEHMPEQEVRDRIYLRSLTYAATDGEKHSLYSPDFIKQIKVDTDDWLLGQIPASAHDRVARWQAFDLQTSLGDEMLAKVDKATMAWGLEARPPLLDHRLVQLALGFPAKFKIDNEQGKLILKKVGERYLPHDVVYRPKQGFTLPIAQWFRGTCKDFLIERILSKDFLDLGVFNKPALEQVLSFHMREGSAGCGALLHNLLCFSLWNHHWGTESK